MAADPGGTNRCALQTCNVLHVVFGAAFCALVGAQFTPFALDTYEAIDLRLVNLVHGVTGVLGCHVRTPSPLETAPTGGTCASW